MGRYGLDLSGSGYVELAGTCEYINYPQFKKPECLFPHFKVHAISPYRVADKSVQAPILIPEDPV
jgi:hypothetical protein